jgi:hypothetical protein
VTFTTQEYLQLLSVLSDGIVVQEAAEKMSISSDCIRFGLHHEQYLVRLTRSGQYCSFEVKCLLASLVKSTCIIDNQGVVNSI